MASASTVEGGLEGSEVEAEASLEDDEEGGGRDGGAREGAVGQAGDEGAGAFLGAGDEAGGLAVGDDGGAVGVVKAVASLVEVEPFGVVDDSHQRAL